MQCSSSGFKIAGLLRPRALFEFSGRPDIPRRSSRLYVPRKERQGSDRIRILMESGPPAGFVEPLPGPAHLLIHGGLPLTWADLYDGANIPVAINNSEGCQGLVKTVNTPGTVSRHTPRLKQTSTDRVQPQGWSRKITPGCLNTPDSPGKVSCWRAAPATPSPIFEREQRTATPESTAPRVSRVRK
jgi:hypothetical protein